MNKSLISKICSWLDAIRLSSSSETQIILIEMVWINETHTHTHTHTHTPHTTHHTPHTKHLEWKITLERVGYENKWYHLFLKNKPTNFTNPSIFMAKIWNPPFLKNLENLTTPKLRKEYHWLKNCFYTFFIRKT